MFLFWYFHYRLEAGVFEESFDEKLMYDDNMIIELIDAACEVLGKQKECFSVVSLPQYYSRIQKC